VEDIGDVLAKAVRSESPQLEAEGLDVELDIASNLPMVRVDRDAIGQVVTNLLSNAAKYGSAGGWVGITARRTPKAVQIIIADKGMGISPEDLDQLFVHFFRSEDADVRKQKGTGIGLSIVRYIVEAHGGEIRADSTRGIGTRFIVTLPLTAALSGV
jgi:signal transduction histidine kinase